MKHPKRILAAAILLALVLALPVGAQEAPEFSAGSNTIAGPGLFTSDDDGKGRVFDLGSGGAVDLCITVRNLARTRVEIRVPGEPATKVERTNTKTRCYGSPARISLECLGRGCKAIWRVDRL